MGTGLRSGGLLVQDPVQAKDGRFCGIRGRCQNTIAEVPEYFRKPTIAHIGPSEELATHSGVDLPLPILCP